MAAPPYCSPVESALWEYHRSILEIQYRMRYAYIPTDGLCVLVPARSPYTSETNQTAFGLPVVPVKDIAEPMVAFRNLERHIG